MNTQWKFLISICAGAVAGAVVVQGLHAQAKPPVLYVVDISEINNAQGFQSVGGRSSESANARIQRLGGRYVARTDKLTAVDGAPPKRLIIISFDSMEKAQAFSNDPSQKEIDATRAKTTKSRSFLAEGL